MLYHITNDQHGAAVAGCSWLPGSRRRYRNFSTSALPSEPEPELARILDILDTQKYIFSTSAPLSLLCVEFEIDISILQISLLCHLGVDNRFFSRLQIFSSLLISILIILSGYAEVMQS